MEPDIGPYEFYIDSFIELSSCRSIGMGAGPIPFTAVVEYSKIFDVGDFEDFLYLIRVMDNTYLKLESEKTKAKSKEAKKPIKRKN